MQLLQQRMCWSECNGVGYGCHRGGHRLWTMQGVVLYNDAGDGYDDL